MASASSIGAAAGWTGNWPRDAAPNRSATSCGGRWRARGRGGALAIIIVDNLSVHTAKGSRLVRTLLAERDPHLRLVYTPASDPDSNRIEWLWRALRRAVTHTHQRASVAALLADADHWAATTTPAQILRQIGSPFAHAQSDAPARDHAA